MLSSWQPESKRKYDDDAMDGSTAKSSRLEKRTHTCSDLIVLGLAWKTTDEQLREYFETFGEVVMAQIKKDHSGASKGFGFVRFANIDSQVKALTQRHSVDGRWCDVKIPNSKQPAPQVPSKIFVGRMTEDIQPEDLRDYFCKFGMVTDVFIPKPFRSFAFVTFSDNYVAQSLCGEDHIVKNTSVHISSASPRNDQQQRGGGGGGRGGAQQLNLGSLNPLAVAAALSQAGWGIVPNQQQAPAAPANGNPALSVVAPAGATIGQQQPSAGANAAYWAATGAAARINQQQQQQHSTTATSGWQ